jgi:hypothetical protein
MEDEISPLQAACTSAYERSQAAYSQLQAASARVSALVQRGALDDSDGQLEAARQDCMVAQVRFDEATDDYMRALSKLNRARMGESS